MCNYKEVIRPFLNDVTKPQRYLGAELNEVVKNPLKVRCQFAFAFPDVYEVGMSHLGLQILYGVVNGREDFLMERVFAPWPDMEEKLRAAKIPLYALESGRAIRSFDCLGFTLQHEMSFTNILNMLDLAQIPLDADQRGEGDPLIIAGGPCACNPEPLSPFLDAVLLGEGEELLPEVLEGIARHKEQNEGRMDRHKLLKELGKIRGVYIPSHYEAQYDSLGAFKQIVPLIPATPEKIKKVRLKDFDQSFFPTKPLVPYIEVVHDRMMTEILRGCTRGCRFCQAGMIYRPVRERSPKTLLEQARALSESTGHHELSLTSLSSSDHTCIKELVEGMMTQFQEEKVSLSLPSLRANHFSVELAHEIQKVRKTGFTFAPEAGSQRLRDVINKGVTEEALMETVAHAVSAGWQQIKFYFMIGLPTETMEDVDAIASLCEKAVAQAAEVMRNNKRHGAIKVTASVSNFVPKPHTPFQWFGQDSRELLKEKHDYLRQRIRDRRISYRYHDAFTSALESVFARGDRRISKVLRLAYEKGCRFDSWSELFRPDLWREAFDASGMDMDQLAQKTYALESPLPWSHLDYGIDENYLKEEYNKATGASLTPDCRYAGCTFCGVCMDGEGGLFLFGEAVEA